MATVKKLGYQGAVRIELAGGGASAQVLASSASIQEDGNPSTFTGVDMPPPNVSGTAVATRSKFVYTEGVVNVSGSVSFDCTVGSMPVVANLCTGRGRRFTVRTQGGEVGHRLDHCYMTSISLSGSTSGLITASLSFVAKNPWESTSGFTPEKRDPSSPDYEEPIAYWYSGGTAAQDVKDWSLTVNQVATPVYGNIAGKNPLYIRIGAMDASLVVNTYLALQPLSSVSVVTQTATLIAGQSQSRSFTMSPSELETYSHTYASMLDPAVGSSGDIITFV